MLTLWQDRQQESDFSADTSYLARAFESNSSSAFFDSESTIPTHNDEVNVSYNQGSKFIYQQTLNDTVEIVGVGLHSGQTATLKILPTAVNTGLQFKRVDQSQSTNLIDGRFDMVTDTQLCTKLSNDDHVSVGTVEHLLSALRAYQIDNVMIEIDGPEVPVLDGSSQLICDAIEQVGLKQQSMPRQVIRILKPISVGDEKCGATFYPGKGFELDFTVKFDCAAIGEQNFKYNFDLESYKSDLAAARTFGFFEEVEHLRSLGLARGGSLDNAIVLKDGEVMNPEGLRFKDEFVRHKILDAMGDLYLAGAQIEGLYVGVCAGHRVNNELLHAVFADPTSWELVYQFEDAAVEELKQAS